MLKINNFVYELFSTLFSLFLQFCLFTYALMFTTFSVYFLSELTMFMMLGLNLKSELNLDFNSEFVIKLLLRLFRLFIITKKFAIFIERLQIFICCLHVPNLGKQFLNQMYFTRNSTICRFTCLTNNRTL